MQQIPVNIITGFLGSGKTTAIINLLQQKSAKERWAVIVNEFGKISIDSQTIRSKSEAGEVYEIVGGCICCSAQDYLHENLDKISNSGKYGRIIIEPSGLGGAEMVSEIVNSEKSLKLMQVICLVDILGIENARLQLNMIYRLQIQTADIIVFSKCDLLKETALTEKALLRFNSLYPGKPNCLSSQKLNPGILDLELQSRENAPKFQMVTSVDITDKNYQQVCLNFSAERYFSLEKLRDLIADNPSVIRAKCHINTMNGWVLLNYSLSGCEYESCIEKKQNELIFILERPTMEFERIVNSILESHVSIDCHLKQFDPKTIC